ncbi:PIN domain-containing protein [Vibrio cholerae]|uniref:hypothetical protein n=1 Tax=Vibrio cholerae TaxID=666 RepID=UPI0028DA1FAC|nr:PIN domain-containing protein [Vibrio cholerae]EKF9974972.1 PIN domain-containing protein [Vibrio cholerae]ELJ8487208.1 PIN domain-containing protein [Vibrio cholerae]ELK0391592.1 PIN domain-containing protein [Vibrio cholerae]HDL9486917.1 PIN domain-containing protein [Vibrio cholerae]
MGIIKSSSAAFPKNQKVLIDTNVLYWLTYANSRVFPTTLKPKEYQTTDYPSIFEKLIEYGNELFFSNYSISELASIIARVEASLDGQGSMYQRKNWLRQSRGRETVSEELTTVVETIESWATALTPTPPLSAGQYLERYQQVYLDGYDINIENDMSSNGLTYILTDDIDFVSVDGLNIITANQQAPKQLLI